MMPARGGMRLLRSEIWRTGRSTALLGGLALYALFAGILLGVPSLADARVNPERWAASEPDIWIEVAAGAGMIGGLLVAVIAMVFTASEFSWGTIRLQMATGLSRRDVFAAKFLQGAFIAVAFFAVTLLVSVMLAGALPVAWSAGLPGGAAAIVLSSFLLFAALGVSTGFLVSHPGAALAVAVGYAIAVEPALFQALVILDWIPEHHAVLPLRSLGRLHTVPVLGGGRSGNVNAAAPLLLVTTAWTALVFAGSWWRFTRKDL
jgi:ABC-type transport system involved in multi-copper enzyme maturation permease subunit